MHIAQVSPLYESVPPKQYGGTERVIAYLTEELIRQGHRVTLFASGDSETEADLVSMCPHSLRLDDKAVDHLAPHVLMLEEVYRRADAFDIIHFHVDYLHYPVSRRETTPHLTTLHGRLDLPELGPLYREFSDMPVVSISDAQRSPISTANWQATVYHGLPPDLFTYREQSEGYLAFLGRISPEKRVDTAIEIASRAHAPLKIAAKVDPADEAYFANEIEPLLDNANVDFVGEIDDIEKGDLLGHAAALLFPIDWPEPFGLVMIEALACGTPVIAYRRGSVPEVLADERVGFVVSDLDEAVEAVQRIDEIDRHVCRQYFEERFQVDRMARDYLRVYEQLIPSPAQTLS
ncbi:glycosyl transferase [Longibacter salinarum]|uniref:Glycosyl transferase n=1 Tax=Longibacter salinarum TaxID=1850348 RepID=A0A2A8D2S8_9BACT|nr:glycosyltransferase family 4 protein [Longibacter salinarum]PEN14958.1 glycosyl transferase [Longibacter salinarum]